MNTVGFESCAFVGLIYECTASVSLLVFGHDSDCANDVVGALANSQAINAELAAVLMDCKALLV
ncbi:hypothetical protein SLEP1_g22673 [Rubroshorea leprosula]|uniref:Uncharacterized protein n=1 Tax=Rubroshorea leprosula TaxID=152421 RepID=A0AAV5JCX2_9ROSI|nr:hypothetical protein SLEP1_g22673 [Rubroshorea leprosula]